MLKRSLLVLRILLVAAALVYAGLLMASAQGPLKWRTSLGSRWLLMNLRSTQFEIEVFTPDAAEGMDRLEETARRPRHQANVNGWARYLPEFEPVFASPVGGLPKWQWRGGVPGGLTVDCRAMPELPLGPGPIVAKEKIDFTTSYFVPGATTFIMVPRWVPLVALATYPALSGLLLLRRALRKRYRRKHGLCIRCGYNLTGLEQARCSECGTGFEREKQSQNSAQ